MVTFEGGTVSGRGRGAPGCWQCAISGGGITGVHFVVSRLVVCFSFCIYVVSVSKLLKNRTKAEVCCPRRENIK